MLERLYEGRFADPAFLSRLDVEFAARYFDALRHWSDGSAACPRVWSVLFRRIPGPDCRPLPSAAAGVNAHINFDLPFALVTTFDHLGSDPVDDGDQHHDYLQINEIFAEAIPELRRGYLDKWQLLIDTMNGDLDDWWQGEVVEYTRNVAWRNAQKLWAVRHDLRATAKERSPAGRQRRRRGPAAALPDGRFPAVELPGGVSGARATASAGPWTSSSAPQPIATRRAVRPLPSLAPATPTAAPALIALALDLLLVLHHLAACRRGSRSGRSRRRLHAERLASAAVTVPRCTTTVRTPSLPCTVTSPCSVFLRRNLRAACRGLPGPCRVRRHAASGAGLLLQAGRPGRSPQRAGPSETAAALRRSRSGRAARPGRAW